MITARFLFELIDRMGDVATADIRWARSLREPTDPDAFATEVIFVICNSGMRYTVAQGIFERVMPALRAGRPALDVFRHAGKAGAIERIWASRAELLRDYQVADDKLAFLGALPWIGSITKFHAAKNFGLPVAKPDVHVQRLADLEGTTAQALCERLSVESGLPVAAVDTVLWRACADGLLDSRTGAAHV